MGWFTHVVADEATQGIDPAAQEQSLENFFDRVWPDSSEHAEKQKYKKVPETNKHTCRLAFSPHKPKSYPINYRWVQPA